MWCKRKHHKMHLIIDNREHKLINLYGEDDRKIEQLDLGDVQVVDDEGVPKAIMERKSLADLAASIKDGRLKEQKMRLLQTREEHGALLIYIIEGRQFSFNEEGFVNGLSSKGLVTTIMNTMFRDRIYVVFTQTIIDTCDFVRGFLRRMRETSCEWLDGRKALNLDTYQDAVIKSKRKENVTDNTVFIMQLCAIPGISTKKATALKDELQVNSMTELIKLLSLCGDAKSAQKKLAEVKGLGKVLAEEIVRQLGIIFEKK